MKSFIRFLLAIAVVFIGWNAGARLQVFEPATLVVGDAQATTYKGRVSRELLTGDWIVQIDPQVSMLVSKENFGALEYQGSGLNAGSLGAVLAGFVVALLIGCPGVARWFVAVIGARPSRTGGAAAP